ncbi:MAG: beta-galactosidase [Kiritimatiellaeota bacterium]|nr:beta-galactosidase [Kiritimatiellota bacterium]
MIWAAGVACGAPAACWHFDGDLSAGDASALAGKAGEFEKGTLPVFDADVPAANTWDGATFALANPANKSALRFFNDYVTGAGSPIGGEVVVAGAAAQTQPTTFTVEAFVKMNKQMPRHALLASKRRNGQTGASWSLSIDPQGNVRARFDTQPGADSKSGEGFNQTFAASSSVTDGAWHHVALSFDRATLAVAIYVDHVRCGGGTTKGPLVYDGGPLVLGRGLDGWLDEVRLTGEVLHPEQFLRTTRFFSELKPRAPAVTMLDQTPTRVQSALKLDWKKIGTLKPKSVDELGTSMWSLGCETLDRDLADWDVYKTYLQPLGIKRIRLQGGWNRTEKQKGVYDFAWLDHIVDDAHARGLTVCLETSYNNHLYEPQGATGPGGQLPQGEETLAAWDKWVEAMARHYVPKGVHEWMMYNEPNLNKSNTLEKIVANNIRTAEIIKRVDPQAQIGAFVLSSLSVDRIEKMLELIKAQGKLDLFHWAIYHGYSGNPDRLNEAMKEFTAMLARVAPQIKPWQGEAGCASEEVQFALSGINWTEYSHAKWNARRMLCDLGHGIESSVFTITDLAYHKDFISRYGLLKTSSDNAIIRVKIAYYVVQNVVSVFNDALERVPDYALTVTGTEKALTWFAFRDKKSKLDVVTLWDGTEIPSNNSDVETVQVSIKSGHFKQPVWVDLITGNVYEIPAEQMQVAGETVTFKELPVYDGPAAITDRSLLSIEPARESKKAKGAAATKAKRAAKTDTLQMTKHLLPGTQQPAPAVLLCAAKGEDVGGLVKWLNAQDVHVFIVESAAAMKQALQTVRSHAAEWQVKSGSVGVLGCGKPGAESVKSVIGVADFAVLLDVGEVSIPETKRKAVFTGKAGEFEKSLAAWLEKYKGKVF